MTLFSIHSVEHRGDLPSLLGFRCAWAVVSSQLLISGLRPAHGLACSKAALARKTEASEKRGPTICKPTGNPSDVNPHGTVAAGNPVRLNG